MMFKNTLKLSISNFYNFWKILLYKMVVFCITILCLSVFKNIISSTLSSCGFITKFLTTIDSFVLSNNILLLMQNIYSLLLSFFKFFIILFNANVFAGIYITFILFIFLPFLLNLSHIPFAENNYGYMSSLSKVSFLQKFITKFGANSIYSIFKTLMNLILIVTILVGNYFILSMSFNYDFMAYIVPIIFVIFNIGIISLYQSVMCGYIPACVVHDDGAVKGFRQGLKAVSRRFFRILSNLICFNILFFAMFYLFGIYSLIAFIPFYTHIMITFGLVMFFGSNGMRYYVDLDTILTPKKLETYDKYKKVKDLI